MSNKLKPSEIDATGAITDDVIKYDGSEFVVGTAPSGGGGGGWTQLGTTTLGSDSSSISVSGLSSDSLTESEAFILHCTNFTNDQTIGATSFRMRFNGRSALGDYKTQSNGNQDFFNLVGKAGVSGQWGTNFIFIRNAKSRTETIIISKSTSAYNQDPQFQTQNTIVTDRFNVNENITSIELFISASDKFASGSTLTVYKGQV